MKTSQSSRRGTVASDFGNRYAEGWPGERVYAGCTFIDKVENICNDLARSVFKAEFADCRATSGVVANLAIYSAFSNPGDTMLTSSIPTGGHISHGKKEHSGTAGLVHGLAIEHFPFFKRKYDHRCWPEPRKNRYYDCRRKSTENSNVWW